MQNSERAALHFLWSRDGGAGPLGPGRSFWGETLHPQTGRRSLQSLRKKRNVWEEQDGQHEGRRAAVIGHQRTGRKLVDTLFLQVAIHKVNITTGSTITALQSTQQLPQHLPNTLASQRIRSVLSPLNYRWRVGRRALWHAVAIFNMFSPSPTETARGSRGIMCWKTAGDASRAELTAEHTQSSVSNVWTTLPADYLTTVGHKALSACTVLLVTVQRGRRNATMRSAQCHHESVVHLANRRVGL